MKSRLSFINEKLKSIKRKDLFRELKDAKVLDQHITIKGKNLINFCSNNYLSLKSRQNIRQFQSSSRLISGNDPIFRIFEDKLSKHKSQERSLIFPTGYMANLGAISSIVSKNDVIFSDELNHASIIEACRLSGAEISVYKHNNIEDLERKITTKKKKRKFVITEGVFSMDGDIANLKEIAEVARKNDAITVLDDAHGDFVLGTDGKGTASMMKLEKEIDLYISSLSKGLGSFGGYVSSQNNIIEYCINKAKSFIYTSALPSSIIEDALKKFESDREKQRKKLENNVKRLTNGMKNIGFSTVSETHIIPIILGKERKALDFGKFLYNHGLFAHPIRYPTVPQNKARIRFSVVAALSTKDIDYALDTLESAGKKFKLI